MKLNRSELREKVMIILYQSYLYDKDKIDYDIKNIINENIRVENEFLNTLVFGVIDKQKELDELINKYMKDWKVSRLGIIDQAIFRMSTFELLYLDTPKIVSINEGIELTKKYSDESISKMLNAVLDNILDNEVKYE